MVSTLTSRYLAHAFCVKRMFSLLLLLVLCDLNQLGQRSVMITSLGLLSPYLNVKLAYILALTALASFAVCPTCFAT